MNQYLQQAIKAHPEHGYLKYHAKRFDRLLALLHQYHADGKTVLNIGRSAFDGIAHQSLDTPIDTLGFDDDATTETGHNYQFNLNNAQSSELWRKDIPSYDIIVFAEVLEHLHTSPKLVLGFLRSLLKPNGVLILQTPNAVVLHKRIFMLLGKHPYQQIAENVRQPTHFREYTLQELQRYSESAGYTVLSKSSENYFDYRFTSDTGPKAKARLSLGLINLLYAVLPASLKAGLCLVLTAKT